jgi:hypothetical protein
MLHLLGKGELDLAIEQLHSGMREASFRELFPDLTLVCEEKASPYSLAPAPWSKGQSTASLV